MAETLFKATFRALGGINEVQIYAPTAQHGRKIIDHVIRDVQRIEKKFSRYLPESVVSSINRDAFEKPFKVDPETALLLNTADAHCKSSGGLFDLTSGVLRRVWDFQNARVPSVAEVNAVLARVGWHHVRWEAPYLSFTRADMELDFGGIGKEYAVDRAAERCHLMGVRHGLINFSGDLRALGPHRDGRPWRIGLTHPRKRGGITRFVELYRGALATSGDYERFFEIDGRRYCHILNPRTGFPTEDLQAVSILAPTCVEAGLCATITMLFGEEEGREFLRHKGHPYFLVNRVGAVVTSQELAAVADRQQVVGAESR